MNENDQLRESQAWRASRDYHGTIIVNDLSILD